jgi:hypothetical protein
LEKFFRFEERGTNLSAGDYHVYPITAGDLIVVGFFIMNIVRDIPPLLYGISTAFLPAFVLPFL